MAESKASKREAISDMRKISIKLIISISNHVSSDEWQDNRVSFAVSTDPTADSLAIISVNHYWMEILLQLLDLMGLDSSRVIEILGGVEGGGGDPFSGRWVTCGRG